MNRKTTLSIALLCAATLAVPSVGSADSVSIANTVRGRILLDVETNGEAWYVYPPTDQRHYLGRPEEAFQIMRGLGLGITNENLEKINVGLAASPFMEATDADGDGLSDNLEKAIGSNPQHQDTDADGFTDKAEVMAGTNVTGTAPATYDTALAREVAGKILLKVEGNGEAFYVNPTDLKRYYLGRPADAFTIMRELGLGITVGNLNKVAVAPQSALPPAGGAQQARTQPQSNVAPAEIHVEAGEYWLQGPDSVTLAPGQDLKITFVNKGTIGHDLKVAGKGVGTEVMAAGGFTMLDIDASLITNGSLTFYCSIGNHRAMGMEKKVNVVVRATAT